MKFLLLQSVLILSVNSFALAKTPEIQGHRGARTVRPENTLVAFQYAMEHDVDVLEMDLSYTKDKHLVLGHDEKLNPDICLDKNGKKLTKDHFVHLMTLKEVQEFDCGTLINPRFPAQVPSPKEKMPSFEEVLKAVRQFEQAHQKSFKLNVEIKVHNDYITQHSEEIIKKLIDLVKKYDLYEKTTIQSFDIQIVDQVRQYDPAISTAFLIHEKLSKVLETLGLKNSKELVEKYKFNIISPNYKLINRAFVREFHSQRIQVIPWTVNEAKDWKKMVNLKVDAIITDDPKGLKEFLK